MKHKKCTQCDVYGSFFGDICGDCHRKNTHEEEIARNRANRINFEIDKEEFKDKVKNTCFLCGDPLPGTIEFYMENGNACRDQAACKTRKKTRNEGYLNDIRILT